MPQLDAATKVPKEPAIATHFTRPPAYLYTLAGGSKVDPARRWIGRRLVWYREEKPGHLIAAIKITALEGTRVLGFTIDLISKAIQPCGTWTTIEQFLSDWDGPFKQVKARDPVFQGLLTKELYQMRERGALPPVEINEKGEVPFPSLLWKKIGRGRQVYVLFNLSEIDLEYATSYEVRGKEVRRQRRAWYKGRTIAELIDTGWKTCHIFHSVELWFHYLSERTH